MISINRLEEMAIEELQTELKNFEEQIKLQNNFIDSLLKATNNSEWLDKYMLDDEVSEVIEKIELDYEQLDQLKAENEELKTENNTYKSSIIANLDNNISKRYRELLEENDQLKEELTISIQENEEGREINAELKAENEELKKQLESTKGLVTVGNKQLAEALLKLQKYKDREQWEIELNKKRADSFKEMRKMLYGKVEGSSLIEKRNPYEN